ncbi:DUF58 domain-containing protein [Aerolutibacter ruishenii]|uniref:Uncharacterized protein DUF58 n=1 Tax=Aerolutibacter ruishenii TaxID=686800 RepID=A0A562LGP0_9GAMM|nr:DUF58 domain-containing protein [Lysobacter ruishenii]TWI06765.1 uncharacterized protein DUF58 [Lysobacter ruishenii]
MTDTWQAAWRDRAAALARPRHPEAMPARLDRRRVYVLPTRFGLFYGVLLSAMLLGALNYNNNPALLLALLLAGTGLASLVAAHLQLTGLEIVAVDGEPVAAGRPLVLRLHATAPPDRVRRGLQVAFVRTPADRTVLHLDQGHGEADLSLPTRQRGWLDIPRLTISTIRPLGLARAWAYVWPDAPLLVYPAPEPAGPPLPEGAGDRADNRLHPAGEDVHHLRPYRPGDARRAIAWKPSARRDQLIVREYEQPQGAETTLDWSSLRALPHEARIARLARWVDEAERTGRRYRLALPGQPTLGPDHGPHHRHACLRALALMPHG